MPMSAGMGDTLAQERLRAVAELFFEIVQPDEGVYTAIQSLAEAGATTLQDEFRANDQEAVNAAEARLAVLLFAATARGLGIDDRESFEDALRSLPIDMTRLTLSSESVESLVGGLCPGFWPFC